MISYIKGAELPPVPLRLLDSAGTALALASGWTFTVKIGHPGETALYTKTTGIVGSTPAPGDTTSPNLVISWTAGELDALPVDRYRLQLQARNGSDQDRIWQLEFALKRAVA